MQINDIKHRCLVVGETYDDFSNAIEQIDFSVEDLCCQVVELTNVYYFLNTESIWGPLGFTWDIFENYGHFSATNLSFNIIPKIPDSTRHKTLKNIFNFINRPLIFDDSNWSHITTFNSLNNNQLIDWHIESLNDGKSHVINSGTSTNTYILRGIADTIVVNGNTNIKLIPENKNKLNLDVSHNIGYIDVESLEVPSNETLDIRPYIRNENITYGNGFKINNSNNFKKILLECRYGGSSNLSLGFNTNDTSNIKEKVTYILRPDLFTSNNITLTNINQYKAKEFEYQNIDNSKIKSIDYYFAEGYFENGTPEITQAIKDFTTISIFRNCHFYKKYPYGSLKPSSKIFENCIAENYIEKNTFYRHENKEDGTGLVAEIDPSFRVIDLSPVFDFDYGEDDFDTTIVTPKIENASGNVFYDLKVPLLYNKNNQYVTSTGTYECVKNTSSILIIFDTERAIKVKNNIEFYYSYQTSTKKIYTESLTLRPNQIIFETTKDNITDVGTQFSNAFIWKIYHDQGIEIPYIIRNETKLFEYNKFSEAVRRRLWLYPTLDTELILYKITINFSHKLDPLPNDLVQYILNHIITVGNIEDSKEHTITLLSEYYQNMDPDTKQRLLNDGYTIVEVL